MRAEMKALGDGIIAAVKGLVRAAEEGLARRIDAVEQRFAALPVPKDGAVGADGAPGRDGVDGKDGADGQPGAEGKDGAPGRDGIDGAPGKDGADGAPGRDAVDGERGADGAPGADGKDGAPGRDGADGQPGRDGIDGQDGAPGNDGKSISVEDVAVLVQETVQKAMAAVPVAKDGAPGRDGVDGAPGAAGAPGRDAAHIEILPHIDAAKSYPRGTYAKHAGGLWRSYETTTELKGWECIVEGIAQLSIEQHPENPRKFLVNLSTSGGRQEVKEFSMPVVLYRGIFKEGDAYEAGDSVTWGGSTWIALQDTGSKPDSVDGTWRLAVKRGSPGKDAVPVKSGGPEK